MALKIALLTYSTQPRGSVVHTLELANALHKLGHQPCVFGLDKSGKGFYRQVAFQTCTVPAAPYPQEKADDIDGLIKQRIGEFISFFQQHSHRYDIYHAQDCLSANALASLRAQGNIPHFVRTVHHIENFRSPYLQACQEKSIYEPDRCLCVSDVWQQALKEDYCIEAHRVMNGVSDRFSPLSSPQQSKTDATVAKAYGISGAPIYLTVGGIEPRKNSIRLLKAFAQIRQSQPNAQLVIVGGATLFDYQDYRQTFMTLAQTLDLQSALCLPGVVSDEHLPSLYRLADAFVFPSIKEGWGLVVLEAIASHLPVLTSNQAPFTEFLSAESALLVNPQDEDAIAQAMLNIIQPQTAQRLIQNSQLIAALYSWQTSAQSHLALYHQLS
ncbi:MAG: MSMEG_0565 family glycosyltransferase [Phormidesmis sp.]